MPWALHIFATKEGRNVRCDFDMFAEWIPNKSKQFTFENVQLHHIAKWVQDTCMKCNIEFTAKDAAEIEYNLKLLKQDLKG